MNGPRLLSLFAGAALALCVEANAAGEAPPPSLAPPAPVAQIEAGRHLAVLGDCEGCHDRPGGEKLAGGLPLHTPFGTIYSANITPDPQTGIGDWTADDFWNAMHRGVRPGGAKLYPAFPYPYFTHVTRAETDAIFAYLKSVPPVTYRPPRNQLPFPFNIRPLVAIWNWMNFKQDDRPGSEPSRGAHIVEGLGHCGACHTPKNFLGGDKRSKALQGGKLDNWLAPALNSDPRRGLGSWSQAQIAEYLKTGRNDRSNASGPMGDVVAHSGSRMQDSDLAAIAVYLKSRPAPPPASFKAPDKAVMSAGEAIFTDQCSACHRADATGEPREFPSLKGSAVVQQDDPTTVVRFILSGTQTVATAQRPTAFSMPDYAWKLDDKQVAAVATYIRNAWGNAAPPVSAGDVAHLRKKVAKTPVRKPSSPV
jgi:mono/diheme cytochrome c family protein